MSEGLINLKKRVNIGLKEKVHTQAKVISVLKKMPLSKYLEQAIEAAIEKDKKMLEEVSK
ncbi:hypothetical protein HYU11_04710 [Candidatus Woesearchaeota archaeon]|nr:hypothetical protein [Candidatus Woesearchaeota archaeon]